MIRIWIVEFSSNSMDNSVRCCETRIHLLDFEDSQGYL